MACVLCFAYARDDDDLTIDVFDVIGSDFWGDGITAKSISRVLTTNADAKAITLRINSPGGDVFEGTAIYNLLRAHSAKVKVQIIGLAASMGSILALAGSHVSMAANAMMMIHDPWSFAIGSGDDMRKTAGMLDKVKETLLNVYAAHSSFDREKLAAMMSDETWLTADEAKVAGFVDEITAVADEADEEPGDVEANARARAVLDKFQRAPAGVHHRYSEPQIAAMAKPKAKQMDLAQIIKALGLPADTTEEQALAAISDTKAKAAAVAPEAMTLRDAVPRADYDKLQADLAKIKAETQAEADKAFAEKADAAVASAIASGKVTPASKDYHLRAIHAGKDAAAKQAALEDFTVYVKGQPELVGTSQMEAAAARQGDAAPSGITAEERQICRALGLSPEEFAKSRKDIAEDPETYAPEAYRNAL